MRDRLDRFFGLRARGTTVATEVRAGLVTFLTMAYILLVNPQILSEAGMPAEDVTLATALSAALATLLMGLYARYPFALAPGMGLNAYFTYGVVLGMGVSYQTALAAVFIEGVLFVLLAVGGLRTAVVNAIPLPLKHAITCGIGLFLALIGLQNAGLVVDHPVTLLTLGDPTGAAPLLALAGLVLTGALLARGLPGALLIGILAVTAAAWLLGVAPPPEAVLAAPRLPRETLLALDFTPFLRGELLVVIFALLFVDFFDTAGTLIGVGELGGYLDEEGRLERADEAFTADAVGTVAGALLGTSTVTSYIESGTGIEAGGRTGLTAVVVAVLFLLAVFLTPLFVAVPAAATAPALVVVGVFMMQSALLVDWRRFDDALPAFLTIAAMPFTYSIANGIVLGLLAYVVVKALSGRAREVPVLLYALAAILLAFLAFVGR